MVFVNDCQLLRARGRTRPLGSPPADRKPGLTGASGRIARSARRGGLPANSGGDANFVQSHSRAHHASSVPHRRGGQGLADAIGADGRALGEMGAWMARGSARGAGITTVRNGRRAASSRVVTSRIDGINSQVLTPKTPPRRPDVNRPPTDMVRREACTPAVARSGTAALRSTTGSDRSEP